MEPVDQPLVAGASLHRLRRDLAHDEPVHVILSDPEIDHAVARCVRADVHAQALRRAVPSDSLVVDLEQPVG
jgi:hypothetical protein